jgi:predicted RND superfamily exporter protein
MATWLIAVTTIPASLLRARAVPPSGPGGAVSSRWLLAFQDRLSDFTERYRWPILGAGAGLTAASVAGILMIHATTDLVGFLKPSHPLQRAYGFIEGELGGIRPLDVTVRTGPGDLLEPEVLRKLGEFQDWIKQQPEVDHAFSIVDYLRRMHQAMHDGDPRFFALPDSRKQAASYLLLFEDPVDSRTAPFLYPNWEQAEEARIRVRTRNLDTVQVAQLVARVEHYVQEHGLIDPTLGVHVAAPPPSRVVGIQSLDALFGRLRRLLDENGAQPTLPAHLANGQMAVRVTGAGLLYSKMANSVVEGQISSLFLAFTVVWITVVCLMSSVRIATLAMIPNVFPILVMLGIIGFAGVPLDLTNAMISAIAIGIAVDDTVHFLSRYRRLRAELPSERAAVRATMREIGRPMIFTSVVLALGFLILCISDFQPHFYFALLSALAVSTALLGDLVLLPACLFIFKPSVGVRSSD